MRDPQTEVRKVLTPVTLFYGLLSALSCVIALVVYQATWIGCLAWSAFGLLLWTLIEYVLHRFVLHSHRVLGPLERWHGHKTHHQDPDDLLEIAYPVLYPIPVAVLVVGFLVAATRSLALTLPILPGLFFGYVYYEWVHFACHYWTPRNRLFRWQVKNHFHHHFKNPSQRYGVTNPLWDAVFFTL